MTSSDVPRTAAGGGEAVDESDGPIPEAPALPQATPLTVPDIARSVAALAMLGAAVIHFAFAPDHFDEQTSHGVFFLVVGWSQLVGAAALGFRWRPQRGWLLGSAALNGGVAALWLLTRTAGLPGDDAEAVGFPDSLATALEVVAAACALAIALHWLTERRIGRPAGLVTGVSAVAMIAVVTASIVPSVGGGHGHGDGHGEADHAGTAGEAAAGHADHAGGADADWNAQRLAALSGYAPDEEVEAAYARHERYLAEQIRSRSRTLGDVPEDERERRISEFVAWSVRHALDAEEAPPGQATMHSHGVQVWQPLTDQAEIAQLQQQLQKAGTVIPTVPTAADALAKGYMQVTPFVPGIGAHYLNIDLLTDGVFDPAQPEMLLYNGNAPTSELVGLSYAFLGDEPPEGFVGPNDEWHVHPQLCIVGVLVVGPDSTPEDLCESIGGRKGMGFDHPMWMGHLWQVPGWESAWGLFSGENPAINMATEQVTPA
jgi:hypothetical protein